MAEYPRPIEACNAGDGSPLVLGDENQIGDMHSPNDPTSTVHVVDWNGDGEPELVCSGNEIYVYRFIDALSDGTPIVDRGMRWGMMSRDAHRNQNDQGLTGHLLVAADFDGDGHVEAIVAPRYYSGKSYVAVSLAGAAPTNHAAGIDVVFHDPTGEVVALAGDRGRGTPARGAVAAVDWNGDTTVDLVVVREWPKTLYVDPATGVAPEDLRQRYHKDGKWIGELGDRELHLYRNATSKGQFEFAYAGRVNVQLPHHTMWITAVNPNDSTAGLLLATYYGRVYHLPLLEAGEEPKWGELAEIFTLQHAPFHRTTTIESSIGVSDALERDRFDLFVGDKSQSPSWCRYWGQDCDGRPVYDTPKRIKQYNPHVGNSGFSVPTIGDWRGTGTPDLLVGGVEGYVLWYKTISTCPLRFAPPERVRYGTTEIRQLAVPNPAAGYNWGGSQGPYDGHTGGYSNPVLADWDGDGLLDLLISSMIGLYDWYPNWGTTTDPELGPPQRLRLESGEPLMGPWRQQPGVGNFTDKDLPDIIIQDQDLDLALFRRAGKAGLSVLLAGEKLRYEDGSTIKTHGVYTPGGGDGRGRTKIDVVDWDHDGVLDLLLGVGPQHGSPYRGSYVLFAKNVGTNESPVFKRPEVVLWDGDGQPLESWRHGVHMAAVDWDGDGMYEIVAGADQGRIWYWKPEHFGKPASGDPTAPLRPENDTGLG